MVANPTLFFLILAFGVMVLAQPLANLLHLPLLIIYLFAGFLLGPSGFNLIPNQEAVTILSEIGLILLMFSTGLKLAHPASAKRRHAIGLFLFNGLLAGVVVAIVTAIFLGPEAQKAGIPLLLGVIFTSSSLEVVIPFLHEFSFRLPYRNRAFISTLHSGIFLSEIACFFLFFLTISYLGNHNLRSTLFLLLIVGFYLVFLFLLLPSLFQKIAGYSLLVQLSEENQSRLLLALLVAAVIGANILKIHSLIVAFLLGLALVNLRLDRRVLHNIDFLASGIFAPFFFLTVGSRIELKTVFQMQEMKYLLTLLASLFLVKVFSVFLIARQEHFSKKEALGFGLATLPHLSSTVATTFVGYQLGIIPTNLFNSITTLCLLTSCLGPILSKPFLFPGGRLQPSHRQLEDYLDFEIHPLLTDEPLSTIMRHIKGLELPIYPVVDRKGIYQGVIHLADIRNRLFDKTLDGLVLAADLTSRDYPFIYRDEPVEKAVSLFKECGCYGLPVLEVTEEGDYFVGMLLLKDILVDFPIWSA